MLFPLYFAICDIYQYLTLRKPFLKLFLLKTIISRWQIQIYSVTSTFLKKWGKLLEFERFLKNGIYGHESHNKHLQLHLFDFEIVIESEVVRPWRSPSLSPLNDTMMTFEQVRNLPELAHWWMWVQIQASWFPV